MTLPKVCSVGRQIDRYHTDGCCSAKDFTRSKIEDILSIKEEFRARKGREVLGLENRTAHSEPHGT